MLPVNFEGAREIHKPPGMKDEECSSLMIQQGYANRPGYLPPAVLQDTFQAQGWPFTLSHWQPSKEDIEAINAGRGIWVRILSHTVHPIEVLTLDELGNIN